MTYRGGDQLSPQIDPDLYTGLIEVTSPGGWDRELQIYIEHDDPYPFTALGYNCRDGAVICAHQWQL